jgi:DNA-binding MurR/RpiR family transcriptional regulator
MGNMNKLPEDVITKITSTHTNLSKSQQKVVEFILDKGIEALYMTSSQIADAVAVNRSTVVRTAQALGYEGFSELQTALQANYSQQFRPSSWHEAVSENLIEQLVEVDESNIHSVLRHMVQIETRNLSILPELINSDDFKKAVDVLITARTVNLMGYQLSKAIAMNFYYPLSLVRPECYLLEPESASLIRRMSQFSSEDVLFAISNYPYSRLTLQSVEFARSVGSTVVALTDSLLSPIAKQADITLVIPSRLWFFGNSIVTFALVNALSASVLLISPNSVETERRQTEKIYKQLRTFIEDDTD